MIRYCKRCVMSDASDKTITFDENGFCNYCTRALALKEKVYFPDKRGEEKLRDMLQRVKASGVGKKYDCIMGISGGLDSSYLAYKGYQWGLRILAVHIDDGFDTEVSKENIRKLCEACNIELRTIKPDEEQFNDLLLAYMKAGVPNLAVPQDNVLLAFLYETMREERIKYFLSGGNFALESILQRDSTISNLDVVNLKDIHKKYGQKPINKLRFISYVRSRIYRTFEIYIEERPLNYINYNRDQAFKELHDFCGFEYYGRKHLENILTAFIQLYWLPHKFGVDKRNSHLSSMIISNQLTRDEALEELKKPLYDEVMMENYITMIASKLNVSRKDIDEYLNGEPHQHEEFKTDIFAKMIVNIMKKTK